MSESLYTDGSIEPQVNTKGLNDELDALTSIAISLKRIADAFEHQNDLICSALDKLEAIEMSVRKQ